MSLNIYIGRLFFKTMANESFEPYDDIGIEYLGSVNEDELKDSSDLLPVHIKNKFNAKECEMFLSEDTFRFQIDLNGKSEQVEVKLEDIKYERVDHKNEILTVVAKFAPEYSHSVHYFFSFSSTKSRYSKTSLYTPLQILEVS